MHPSRRPVWWSLSTHSDVTLEEAALTRTSPQFGSNQRIRCHHLELYVSQCRQLFNLCISWCIFAVGLRTNSRDVQTLVDADAALWERNGSGLLHRGLSSRPGPAGCHFPATHLNCFTYMYIFIQLMPVQCIILPTRKINTHSSFFF